ncbi:hypothetical protein [Kribbella sp. NPDC051620]|uniref:hypothetical protein n=1 Tax=Kribbella sp. NPDC051620 TaxID=3364120 RepID=UPI0037AB6E02
MPLVDLDDPEELRARWSALAAVAHATGYDRRWYADEHGWYHQDETGSDLRMVRLDGGRAVLFGFHTQHTQTGGADLLAGAPPWIGQPEVKRRMAAGELGFVYGSFNGTWARASYPGDPWQPLDDGFLPIGEWITSDEEAAREMIEWAAEWADYLGGLDELLPVGVQLIRTASTTGITPESLLDLFDRLGIGPQSPQHPDLRAAVAAAAAFSGTAISSPAPATQPPSPTPGVPEARFPGSGAPGSGVPGPGVPALGGPGSGIPAPSSQPSSVAPPAPPTLAAPAAEPASLPAELLDEADDEESVAVPPGISPFTGQPIGDDANLIIGANDPYNSQPPYTPEPPYTSGPSSTPGPAFTPGPPVASEPPFTPEPPLNPEPPFRPDSPFAPDPSPYTPEPPFTPEPDPDPPYQPEDAAPHHGDYGIVAKKPRLFRRRKHEAPDPQPTGTPPGLPQPAPTPPTAAPGTPHAQAPGTPYAQPPGDPYRSSVPYTSPTDGPRTPATGTPYAHSTGDQPEQTDAGTPAMPKLPSSEPRVGGPVNDGEDFYASLFADAPAAATYVPDVTRNTPANANTWSADDATNEIPAITDDATGEVPLTPDSGDNPADVPPTPDASADPADVAPTPDLSASDDTGVIPPTPTTEAPPQNPLAPHPSATHPDPSAARPTDAWSATDGDPTPDTELALDAEPTPNGEPTPYAQPTMHRAQATGTGQSAGNGQGPGSGQGPGAGHVVGTGPRQDTELGAGAGLGASAGIGAADALGVHEDGRQAASAGASGAHLSVGPDQGALLRSGEGFGDRDDARTTDEVSGGPLDSNAGTSVGPESGAEPWSEGGAEAEAESEPEPWSETEVEAEPEPWSEAGAGAEVGAEVGTGAGAGAEAEAVSEGMRSAVLEQEQEQAYVAEGRGAPARPEWIGGAWINGVWVEDVAAYLAAQNAAGPAKPASVEELPTEDFSQLPPLDDSPTEEHVLGRTSRDQAPEDSPTEERVLGVTGPDEASDEPPTEERVLGLAAHGEALDERPTEERVLGLAAHDQAPDEPPTEEHVLEVHGQASEEPPTEELVLGLAGLEQEPGEFVPEEGSAEERFTDAARFGSDEDAAAQDQLYGVNPFKRSSGERSAGERLHGVNPFERSGGETLAEERLQDADSVGLSGDELVEPAADDGDELSQRAGDVQDGEEPATEGRLRGVNPFEQAAERVFGMAAPAADDVAADEQSAGVQAEVEQFGNQAAAEQLGNQAEVEQLGNQAGAEQPGHLAGVEQLGSRSGAEQRGDGVTGGDYLGGEPGGEAQGEVEGDAPTAEIAAVVEQDPEDEYYAAGRSPFAPEARDVPPNGFSSLEPLGDFDYRLGENFHDEILGDADWTADQLGEPQQSASGPQEPLPQAMHEQQGPEEAHEPTEVQELGGPQGLGEAQGQGAPQGLGAAQGQGGSQGLAEAQGHGGPQGLGEVRGQGGAVEFGESAEGQLEEEPDAREQDELELDAREYDGRELDAREQDELELDRREHDGREPDGPELDELTASEVTAQFEAIRDEQPEPSEYDPQPYDPQPQDAQPEDSAAEAAVGVAAVGVGEGPAPVARPEKLVVPDEGRAVAIPGLGVVGGEAPPVETPPGSIEEAMRAEVERPRPRPKESAAFRALREWCRARTKVVPSGFTIQVQVLDPAAPSYRFDLEPPEVDDPEYGAEKLTELLGDLWIAESQGEQGGWLFARMDAAGRTLRIDRWYDSVPDWWDNPVEPRLDVDGLVRRLNGRGADWQPSYLEKLYTSAR